MKRRSAAALFGEAWCSAFRGQTRRPHSAGPAQEGLSEDGEAAHIVSTAWIQQKTTSSKPLMACRQRVKISRGLRHHWSIQHYQNQIHFYLL